MEKVFATDRLKTLLPKVKAFVQNELLWLEAEHHSRSIAETYALLDGKRDKVKAAGLWGLHFPKNEGGWGLTLCEFAQISEALALTPFYGHYAFNCQAPDIGNTEILFEFGTEEQKAAYLQPLIRGDIRSCFSMTEPECPGSNPVWMNTTAVKVVAR